MHRLRSLVRLDHPHSWHMSANSRRLSKWVSFLIDLSLSQVCSRNLTSTFFWNERQPFFHSKSWCLVYALGSLSSRRNNQARRVLWLRGSPFGGVKVSDLLTFFLFCGAFVRYSRRVHVHFVLLHPIVTRVSIRRILARLEFLCWWCPRCDPQHASVTKVQCFVLVATQRAKSLYKVKNLVVLIGSFVVFRVSIHATYDFHITAWACAMELNY